ncbi:DnaB-like helicase N-terminal domain-containing protein [Tardiphaga sp. 709]|uniref:DnaB-like helicase N-terminal domain-containing protein n=1 Tax=Tardiphaga sp. 709 TaxID=3076039 RepID=UPI0028E88B92|nr:DnaB-like helicase N-terminal domain-containing protein [Tardiphaga sp. 709]WNV10124.1 DnaB-like helicase N-terminal domain-containing protein [Tardiphaga sp. 709]
MTSPIPARDPRYVNQSAERSLLGAMLINNDCFVMTAGKIDGGDFSENLHAYIFNCIAELIKAKKYATPVTVRASLLQRLHNSNPHMPETEDMDTGRYLAKLAAEAHSGDPVSLAVRLRQLTALHGIVQLAKSFEGYEADDILMAAEGLALDGDFFAMAMRGTSQPVLQPRKEHDELEKLHSAGWKIAIHNHFGRGVYWMMTHIASSRFIYATANDDITALGILLLKSGLK